MLQAIYISVGILTLTAISIFTICQCFSWFLEMLDKVRTPYLKYFYSRHFIDMSNAFYMDKKVSYIFETLSKDLICGRAQDVWKFRDEVEAKFGRE